MRATSSLAGLFAAAAIAAPGAVHADIYKWVDEKGGVTYGNVPPPSAKKVRQLDEDSRVSTVPGIPPEELARLRQLEMEARLQRLERELYEQRLREAMAAQSYYPYSGYGDYYGSGYGYGYGWGGYAAYPWWFASSRFGFVGPRFVRHPVRVQHPIVIKPGPVRVGGGGRHR